MDSDEFRRRQEARIIAHWRATKAPPPPRTDHPITDAELLSLQQAASMRAAEMWDAGEADDFRGDFQSITEPLVSALEVAADDFTRRRTTPWWDGEYQDYLRTPHWREARLRALQRSGFRCQRCESPRALDVHHRDYRHLGAERERDLMVLCRECHALAHGEDADGEAADPR